MAIVDSRKKWLMAASGVLLLVCYRHVIAGMIEQWMTDEDVGHGFLVPFAIAFVLWRERGRWSRVELKPSAWGLAFLAAGIALQMVSAIGAGLFAGSVALVLSILGAVICLGGFGLLKSWSFPVLLTLFMLPKLAIVYNQVTLPLQLLASKMAAGILTASGVAVLRSGNVLDVNGHRIAVAEACNGIRYLLPLGFTSVLFAYLTDARAWMRVVFLLWAIPVAIAANALRVAASAYSPKLAEGNPHLLMGTVIFLLCLATLVPFRRLWNA